jgi:tetratricopeptide (TPR) repeat protein
MRDEGGNRAERRRRAASTAGLAAGLEHHRVGRLERAESLYRQFLRKSPDNPDALHLLGVIAAARGQAQEAVRLISRALARVPNFAEGHSNLGNALRAVGRPAEACDSYRRAIALRPDFAAAHTNLGLALCELGQFAAAAGSCRRAVELDPNNAEVHVNLAVVLRRAGRLEATAVALRRAADLNPGAAELHIDLADVLVELRHFERAAACYQRAIELDPRQAGTHRGLATSLRSLGKLDAAIAHYSDALTLNPDEALPWNDLGRCFLALGRFEEAAEAFRRALAADPDLADAYRNLAACRLLSAKDAEFVAGLAAQQSLPSEVRATAGFAHGKALDDLDRYDEAFVAYDAANRLYRDARAAVGDRFDAAALASDIDRLIARFTPTFFAEAAGGGNASELPVFIVGVPRSGTSLVEQIAASHSQIFGAGELTYVGEGALALGPPGAGWMSVKLRQVADAHLEKLRGLGGGALRVIDKMPDNIFMLGLIAALYPAARIIFCRRDPRDIGLSCFFQKFSAGLLTFSYDLADCGSRIRETDRLAAHWRHVLPLRWLDIHYETLVADLENESRRLIEFLGLQWEPACLDFHRAKRVVQTASSWQVRQPLYGRSVGRWRHYEQHLGSLLAELAPMLPSTDTAATDMVMAGVPLAEIAR